MFPPPESELRSNGPIVRMPFPSLPLLSPVDRSAEPKEVGSPGDPRERESQNGKAPSPYPLPKGEDFEDAPNEEGYAPAPTNPQSAIPNPQSQTRQFPHDNWKSEIPARAYDLLHWTSDAFSDPADEFPRAAYIAGAVRLTEIAPENIRWLWPDRIPLGRVTLLVSDPGIGKSLLTLDIAARVSTGAQWPDAVGPPSRGGPDSANDIDMPGAARLAAPTGSVLLLTAEDNLADTIRPRLEALGADCSRIVAISTDHGEHAHTVPRAFALQRDLARLDALLRTMPDCRLVILDPITAYLGDSDQQSNAEIRNLLASLAAMARDRGLAVLIVSHLRKTQGAAIYRTMGSLAFVACARAAWIIAKDPTDDNKRLLLSLKNNLAPDVAGLAYTIESSPAAGVPMIRWTPEPVNISAESMVGAAKSPGRPDDERQYAVTWLRSQLAEGPRLARELKHEADANGISYGTLRRAFRQLGGEAFRRGNFPSSPWHWQFPRTDAQNP
jgi:hypothetical protein